MWEHDLTGLYIEKKRKVEMPCTNVCTCILENERGRGPRVCGLVQWVRLESRLNARMGRWRWREMVVEGDGGGW